MKSYLIVLVVLLSACASPSQQGMNMLNKAQYQKAYNTFVQCSNQGDSNCINNIGYMYENGHMDVGKDPDTAIRFYTWAARYGNPTAQHNLVLHGQTVPPVDLVAQQTLNNDAMWALMLGTVAEGYAGHIESQQQARDRQQIQRMQEQIEKPIHCSSQVQNSGGIINTTCR